jgi:sugar/nucleoside kinase (ribokinase family)
MNKRYQVVGIGNAIVDVITETDDSRLTRMGIEKGIMQLVEQERGEFLYEAMTNRVQAAGGSVANTIAGLGNLGLKTAFIGRVHDDALGASTRPRWPRTAPISSIRRSRAASCRPRAR